MPRPEPVGLVLFVPRIGGPPPAEPPSYPGRLRSSSQRDETRKWFTAIVPPVRAAAVSSAARSQRVRRNSIDARGGSLFFSRDGRQADPHCCSHSQRAFDR